MLLDEKTLNKYELMPFKKSSGQTFRENDYWDDRFRKSANEFTRKGNSYAESILKKNLNKPVKGIINKLKSHPDYGYNKALTNTINKRIKLLHSRVDYSSYRYSYEYYVKDNLIAYHDDSFCSYMYRRRKYLRANFLDTVATYRTYDGYGMTPYVVRLKGLYYYISEEGYWFIYMREHYFKARDVFKLAYELILLDKFDVKHYNLRTLEYYDKE